MSLNIPETRTGKGSATRKPVAEITIENALAIARGNRNGPGAVIHDTHTNGDVIIIQPPVRRSRVPRAN